MERKVICDLHLISVDFGREEERQPGNTFRITFRHANGQPTGTIDVYQGEAAHFSVELEAIAVSFAPRLLRTKIIFEGFPPALIFLFWWIRRWV